jgi:2-polyprenyl-3-methyl-5-hydroxy-6-metoxy-1,4-benzoquinol methylase
MHQQKTGDKLSTLQTTYMTRSRKQFVKNLLKHAKGSKTILDAGCGSGWLCEAFKQQISANVVSVDLRAETLKRNKNNPVMMDIRSLGFTEAFDLVVAKDIIEHLVEPEKAMRQFASVLKPEGKILVNVPTPGTPYFWDDYTHVRPYTKVSLAQLLDETGFEIVYTHYLAKPTIGAALFNFTAIVDGLADLGFRRGSVIAIARKKQK